MHRRAWLQYAPAAAAAPVLLLASSFLAPTGRTIAWTVVAAINVISALLGGRQRSGPETNWAIDPVHFVERHSLFVIISLGEVLVAAGLAVAKSSADITVALGLVAAVSVAIVFWWYYFAYVPEVIEARLRRASLSERGKVARDMFTFGHFPIVAAIVEYSVVARHMLQHPGDRLATADLIALAGSVALFVAGFAALQWMTARSVANERIVAIIASVLWCVVAGPHMSGTIVLFGVAAIVGLSQGRTYRRYRANRRA